MFMCKVTKMTPFAWTFVDSELLLICTQKHFHYRFCGESNKVVLEYIFMLFLFVLNLIRGEIVRVTSCQLYCHLT